LLWLVLVLGGFLVVFGFFIRVCFVMVFGCGWFVMWFCCVCCIVVVFACNASFALISLYRDLLKQKKHYMQIQRQCNIHNKTT
jgi:hypothetical protein